MIILKMSNSNEITILTTENVHSEIIKYISENRIYINSYDDMIQVILKMIENKYMFTFDKNLLRSIMEDLTYMYNPNDDINKDRIIELLEDSDDEEGEIPTIDDNQ